MLGILQQVFSQAVASSVPPTQPSRPGQPAQPQGTGSLLGNVASAIANNATVSKVEIVADRTGRSTVTGSTSKAAVPSIGEALKQQIINAMNGPSPGTGGPQRGLLGRVLFGVQRRSAEGEQMYNEDEAQRHYPKTWALDPKRALAAQMRHAAANAVGGGASAGGVHPAGAVAAGAAAGGGFAAATVAVGGLAVACVGAAAAAVKLGDNQLAYAQGLAQYNANIAGALQTLEIGDINRAIASGQATSGTTSELAAAVNALRDDWRPVGDAMTNGWNQLATAATQAIRPIAQGVARLVELFGFKNDPAPAMNPFFRDSLDAARSARDRDVPERNQQRKSKRP